MPTERGGIVGATSGNQLPHWILWFYSHIEFCSPPCNTEECEQIRVAQQPEPENTLGGLLHTQRLPTVWIPLHCSPPSHQAEVRIWVGKWVGAYIHPSTYCRESAGINKGSNSFLFLLLWRIFHSSKALLPSDFHQLPPIKGTSERVPCGGDVCPVGLLHLHLLYLEWKLTRLQDVPETVNQGNERCVCDVESYFS